MIFYISESEGKTIIIYSYSYFFIKFSRKNADNVINSITHVREKYIFENSGGLSE